MTKIPTGYLPSGLKGVLWSVSPEFVENRDHVWRDDLRDRLAAKDAEIAELTRRLAACVELPPIPILGQLTIRDNSEPKEPDFWAELFDDEGERTHEGSGPTPAAAIAALRQKMEQE